LSTVNAPSERGMIFMVIKIRILYFCIGIAYN
jgi:hypothetical protein